MSLTYQQTNALFKLYPSVTNTIGDVAYDANGNEVSYSLSSLESKVAQDEADKIAAEQAQETAKESALSKLTALGLTADEVKALLGVA